MTVFDAIHPLDDFWFDGEPPDKIENILRRKHFALLEQAVRDGKRKANELLERPFFWEGSDAETV